MNKDFVSIRYFDNLLGMIMGYPPESCDMNGTCSCQMVVEADGSVYPCDFYVIDQWKLGNINENNIDEIQNNDTGNNFMNISKHIDPKCMQCEWLRICRGGCRRNREPFVNGKPGLSYFCEAYDSFFQHSIQKLIDVS